MADEENSPESQESEEAEGGGGGKKGLLIMVGGMMLLEAVGVFMFAKLIAAPPASSHGDVAEVATDENIETSELLLVKERFQNHSTGRVWQWEIELHLKVRASHAEAAEKILEQRQAEITEAVGRVISRAQHAHLKEAEHQSIVRQLTAAVRPFFEPVTAEEPLFERVLLPKCAGHPTDF